MEIEPLGVDVIDPIVRRALDEDRAWDDATTLAVVPDDLQGIGRFLAKEDGVLAGWAVAARCFQLIDDRVSATQAIGEGAAFVKGDVIGEVRGPARAILQAERVALNYLQRLSATATLTRAYVDQAVGTRAVILDTRKTTPSMRDFEKYAVRCGGGTNHRRDLAVMAMMKDNHREALGRVGLSLADGVAAIRQQAAGIPVEVEVDSLDQLEAALEGKPEWVLLDNMSVETMAEAVRHTAGRARLEASGGVRLETVAAIAGTGVDAISAGALTHSAGSLDISLDISFEP